MSFNMQTKSVDLYNNQALPCLQTWSKYVDEAGNGQLACVMDGERFQIKVTSTNNTSIEASLSDLKVHHTYKHISEICSFGVPEISKHFKAVLSGKTADNHTREISLYLHHSCEDGKNWSKSFSVYDKILQAAENKELKAPEKDAAKVSPPLCAISYEPMNDPVTGPDGRNYERSVIIRWLQEHGTSPYTGEVMRVDQLVTNYGLK